MASILKRNGWIHRNKRIDGVQTKGFLRPLPPTPTKDHPPGGGKPATDATGLNNHTTYSGDTKNSTKINNITDATDTIYNTENKYSESIGSAVDSDVCKRHIRFKETPGNIGNSGNIVDYKGISGVTATGNNGTATGSNSGNSQRDYESELNFGEPPTQDDGYMDSLVESLQPGTADDKGSHKAPRTMALLSPQAMELGRHMRATGSTGWKSTHELARELRLTVDQIRSFATELSTHKMAWFENDSVRLVTGEPN